MPDTVTTPPTDAQHSQTPPLSMAMIPVEALTAHPGNVRRDLDLTAEFCASVAEAGVRVPLLVTRAADGYRVIEGHRRLAAAVKAGHSEVPCVLDPSRAGDEAGQYLDMAIANSAAHRRNFAPAEEALALFAAHEAGATRTRIRKATGRKAEDVRTALTAGGLSADTREAAARLPRQASLDELALLAEFDGDEPATDSLLEAFRTGMNADYVAESIRHTRTEAAENERLCAEFAATDTPVTDDAPDGAFLIEDLLHDSELLTPETHAACPGRGVYFQTWNQTSPVHYCSDPAGNGHVSRYSHAGTHTSGDGTESEPPSGGIVTVNQFAASPPEPRREPDPEQLLIQEGNRAWRVAAEVRHRWLLTLFARRTASRAITEFTATQLLTMPEPLRFRLAAASAVVNFSVITGHTPDDLARQAATCPAGRLPLLTLAPIVVAYEDTITGTESTALGTWRPAAYSLCPTPVAATYLQFLASLGYELSPIERSVADGTAYTGDSPADPDDPGTEPADAGDATAQDIEPQQD